MWKTIPAGAEIHWVVPKLFSGKGKKPQVRNVNKFVLANQDKWNLITGLG